MAMKPCKKCGKNDWDYVKLDNDPHIYCTCKNCNAKTKFKIPQKRCSSCNEFTDFERIDVDKKHRGKKCKKCGFVKVLENASAYFVYGVLIPDYDDDLDIDHDKLANIFFDAHPELERPEHLIKKEITR